MSLTAMHPKRHTRAPYRGRCHGQGVHPATRRVDPSMTTTETRHPAGVTHLDGVPWYTAPIPPAGHDCWPQSRHHNDDGVLWLERCPCGAARVHHPTAGGWIDRGSRATGRVLSPSVIRLAAAQAHRRATQHERQAVVTGDRQVIQCSYLDDTPFAPRGARAYVVRINPASGHDRIVVLARTHGNRWVQRWENTLRLGDFRVVTLQPGHDRHRDHRLRTFTDDDANAFLTAIKAAPKPRADVAAAMARVHAGGAR
jgi:hypothetical protein